MKHWYYNLFIHGITKDNKQLVNTLLTHYHGLDSRGWLKFLLKCGLLLDDEEDESGQKTYRFADSALHKLLKDLVNLRKKITKTEGKIDTAQIVQELKKDINLTSRMSAIEKIGKKHKKVLSKYSYLSDIIQIYCPLLYPELPYQDLPI